MQLFHRHLTHIIISIALLSGCAHQSAPKPTPFAPISEKSLPTMQHPAPTNVEKTQVLLKTSLGDITLELYPADAPETVENFLKLTREGFYHGTKFHRVIEGFMIQGGDPLSRESDRSAWGTGGPGYQFEDEINARTIVRGSLAMANSGKDTNGSQFFIVTAEATPWLDGKHTNFGMVVSGMDIVDAIARAAKDEQDRPLSDVVIESIEVRP